ncbi:MAG TPA: FAD-binding oxidoreductase [Ideonella sp.]|uniref:FAD-binding oxidoreductase n=1 Tax=Ideonella sp. TaxID=1929293 RepID=UPI002C8B2385|nr:FAD-binding oxidoreductase [Ideonella sp.]HSI48414.1 FAD-binding oxidoreductase [Ideonella sp.]
MTIVTLASGLQFISEPGSTVLDAALSQQVVIEHSCRTGRCGSCKAKVISGHVGLLREATALSQQEAEAGWILTCAHEARSDLQLDIEDLGALAGIASKTLPARIASLDRLAPDVLRVVLRLPPTAAFRFLAGQYIDLTSPTGVRRSYSIASAAARAGQLELQIRQVEHGEFSRYLFEQAKANDLLRFVGPRGTFFLRPVAGLDLMLLCTGTGIAPMLSMLAQVAEMPAEVQPASVTLYWGGRQSSDLYVDPAASLATLRYVPVLSRADASWTGARGHVQDVLLAEVRNLANAAVYACGSEQMIHGAQQKLLAAGLDPKRFFFDAFVSSN